MFQFFFVCFIQWKEANQDQIMDSKLKCVFDLGDEKYAEVIVLK